MNNYTALIYVVCLSWLADTSPFFSKRGDIQFAGTLQKFPCSLYEPRARREMFYSKIIQANHAGIKTATKISGTINNSRNNNEMGLGQLDADNFALGVLLAFVQNISLRRTMGSLGEGGPQILFAGLQKSQSEILRREEDPLCPLNAGKSGGGRGRDEEGYSWEGPELPPHV